MKLLLDTHTFLWWNLGAPELSATARAAITNGRHTIYLSAASAWEIALKAAKGRLDLPEPANVYVVERLRRHRFVALPIRISHALAAADLPAIHTDPFDRLLVAQAQLEKLTLLTADATLAGYDVAVLW